MAQPVMLPLLIPQEFDPNQYCSLETMYAECLAISFITSNGAFACPNVIIMSVQSNS
jgi:hypothetical protein